MFMGVWLFGGSVLLCRALTAAGAERCQPATSKVWHQHAHPLRSATALSGARARELLASSPSSPLAPAAALSTCAWSSDVPAPPVGVP